MRSAPRCVSAAARTATTVTVVALGAVTALAACSGGGPAPGGTTSRTPTPAATTVGVGSTTTLDPLSSLPPASFPPSSTPSLATLPPATATRAAASSLRSSRCHPTAGAWSTGPDIGARTVALTFDDGPGRDTAAVLDVLAREKVHATFFDIGAHAAIQPDLVRREVAEGHQIGGHSWDHRYPWMVPGGWTPGFVDEQMRDTVAYLRKLTGQSVCFYRPPGGIMTGMTAAAHAEGMQLTLWTVDPKDWAHPQENYAYSADAQGIVARATLPGVVRHPIVLMHDGNGPRGATVAALPHVIEWYRSHGYRFVRLDGRG